MNFQFEQDYMLENHRVLLRPLVNSDIGHLLPFAKSEPDLWIYSLKSAAGEQAMKEYIDVATNARKEYKEYAFIVYDKKARRYAGSTRFYDIQHNSDTVQLGFTWYGKDFQGTVLNKHCKYLLLEFAFEKMGVYRVEFRADHRNIRSIAAMKSIGCTEEGILRSNGYSTDGTRRDSIVLSILNSEWSGHIKRNLFNKLD